MLSFGDDSSARGRLWSRGALPADLIETGIADLHKGVESLEALLVLIGASRLAQLSLRLPAPTGSREHRLYALLAREDPDSAHSRYNALIRRLVSFERAAECASRVDETLGPASG